MSEVDLRPLSLGEILDRAFSLYRKNFVLFIGITAIPQLLSLAVNLVTLMFRTPVSFTITPGSQPDFSRLIPHGADLVLGLLAGLVTMIAYLFSQGGTILAVSDIYLGRSTTIKASLEHVLGKFGTLLGVLLLNGLVVAVGTILCIIPGIYLTCRLLVCVPVALIEKRGPRDSQRRSMALTKGSAGRSFLIVILAVILTVGVGLVLGAPAGFLLVLNAKDPAMLRLVNALTQVTSTISTILISPIMLIATSVYYYDLRVRKEAFDLQFMMDPDSRQTPGAGDVTSIS
jgi:hypothetical protein